MGWLRNLFRQLFGNPRCTRCPNEADLLSPDPLAYAWGLDPHPEWFCAKCFNERSMEA